MLENVRGHPNSRWAVFSDIGHADDFARTDRVVAGTKIIQASSLTRDDEALQVLTGGICLTDAQEDKKAGFGVYFGPEDPR
jgi:hypothetical protein